jgi:glycosyltransferase involved in cell wall biosynthesis
VVFEAFEQLAAEPRWDGGLVVVGQGAELPFWKTRVRAAGLENRIHFLGFRRDVPRIMAACDCLVAPACYEAYGLAAREALCAALPAFVTSSSGVAEEYPTELRRGLLLNDFDDPRELAVRLYQWSQNAPEYRQRVLALSSRLRRWTWDHMSARIVRLVSENQ